MNKGVSRTSRKNKALSPDFISIDERSVLDKMLFTLAFAKDINYYNNRNEKEGNWEDFFKKDSAFAIVKIMSADIGKFKAINDKLLAGVDNYEDLKPQLLANTLQMIEAVIDWDDYLASSNYNGDLLGEMGNLITSIRNSLAFVNNSIQFQVKQSNLEYNLNERYEKLVARKLIAENKRFNLASQTPLDPKMLINTFDLVYGKMVFLQERATKRFEQEIHARKDHLPHIGLLLTFFELSKHLKKEMGKLTKRHLDLYYKKHLRQKNAGAIIAKSLLMIRLKSGSDKLVIDEKERVRLTWRDGTEYDFTTTSVNHLNTAEVCGVKTLYKSNDPISDIGWSKEDDQMNVLYQFEDFKSIDKELDSEVHQEMPLTFGGRTNSLCDIGFVVSSPALILEKGNQEITLSFRMNSSEHQEVDFTERFWKYFRNSFDVYITHPEGWVKIHLIRVVFKDGILRFLIPLDSELHQLSLFDNLVHEGTFSSNWPCIKILLNNYSQIHPYRFLSSMTVEDITIHASVSGVSESALSNTSGELDSSIPFMPFGPLPTVGSFLKIENPRILQRNLSKLDLRIHWSGLPQHMQSGFDMYYAGYPYKMQNDVFKAVITQDRTNVYKSEKNGKQEIPLFKDENGYLISENRISVDLDEFPFNTKIDQNETVSKGHSTPLFMVLSNPAVGFGHNVFSEVYAEKAIVSSRLKRKHIELPKVPYTPIMEKLVLDYRNVAKENLRRKQDISNTDISLTHIYPFGHVVAFPGSIKLASYLLPQITHKGNLFIGLKKVKPLEVLGIGFDLLPATYVHTAIQKPKIQWEYLLYNEWQSFEEFLLEDGTKGLTTSGIIKIRTPEVVQYENTRLPQGQFWIRACFEDKEDINSRVKNIFAQAVTIEGTLSKLTSKEDIGEKIKIEILNQEISKDIDTVQGLFAFELNNNNQSTSSFYAGVSEQLRHKNRALTNWDIERLVLNKFNTIEKVRAYGRSNFPNELLKGNHIQIVVIPKNRNRKLDALTNIQVDHVTLMNIKNYVKTFLSPFVKIDASNALYEKLKVRCRVKFDTPENSGYLRDLLNGEIINYLSPYLDNPILEKGFGEGISRTEILNFVESRPYVNRVTTFSVLQLVEVDGKHRIIDTEVFKERMRKDDTLHEEDLHTISPYVILSSVAQHHIEVIREEGEPEDTKICGLGDIAIGSDYIMVDENENYI